MSQNVQVKKIDILAGYMKADQWQKALSLASKFPRLGEHKKVITRAHNAINSPDIYRQMGYDINHTVNQGIQALKVRYANYL